MRRRKSARKEKWDKEIEAYVEAERQIRIRIPKLAKYFARRGDKI